MAKLSLRSIFSTPLIIVSAIRRIRVDGFLGGIIVGALFSMLVNLVTVQVQEMINKQRVLEAIEMEIFNNVLLAENVVAEAGVIFEEKRDPSLFYQFPVYSRDLWEQSIEPLLYVAQLPPEIQEKVIIYYTTTVKGINGLTESGKKVSDNVLKDCYAVYNEVNEEKMASCKRWHYQIVEWNMESASDMYDNSMAVLDVFHPTQDRLNNWFLKLMLGDKSVRALSGK